MKNFKKNRIKSFLLLLLCCTAPVLAAPHETLPTYHWAYAYLHELQLRGFCLDLLQMNQPYTRGEIARSLVRIPADESSRRPAWMEPLISRLRSELAPELAALNSPAADEILFRANFFPNLDASDQNDAQYLGIYRGSLGAGVTPDLFAMTSVIADQYDYDDPDYSGYKWRGLVGYVEQAYIRFNFKKLHFKFGRDFLKWGIGESGSLLFSNVCQPLDQLFAAANFGPFQFSMIAAELNRMTLQEQSGELREYRRFLSGHRLDASFWRGRLQVGISEVIIFGETNGGMNLINLNPLIFYHLEKKNGAVDNNVLPMIDLLAYPARNWRIYTSLLIDDIQVEKTVVDDLEPNEIGWVVGTSLADPLQIRGLALNFEYTRVANRTYKTPNPAEIFTYRNQPLGHPLGSDFEHWQAGFSAWLMRDCRFNLLASQTRAGEGILEKPWDEPWDNFSLETGYHEPFPSGVIQTTTGLEINIDWLIATWCRLHTTYQWRHLENRNHLADHAGVEWRFKLSAELKYSIRWPLMASF